MGLLSGLFKILHPVRTPKRGIKRAVILGRSEGRSGFASGVISPVDRAEYIARRAVIRKVFDGHLELNARRYSPDYDPKEDSAALGTCNLAVAVGRHGCMLP